MSEMHSVGIHSKSDINPIVDEQPRSKLTGYPPHLPGKGKQVPHRKIFFPELYRLHAALESQPDSIRQWLPRLFSVGDEIEFEIDRHGIPYPTEKKTISAQRSHHSANNKQHGSRRCRI